jgi:hypothetical protein
MSQSQSQAAALYQLQTIELSLLQKQQRLKAIESALQDNHLITEAQNRVDAGQKALNPLRTQTRNLELELQTNVSKARAAEDQLYGGRVRNPKELHDLQLEIDALKRRHSELEDKLLEVMLEVEEAEQALSTAESALEEARKAHGGEQSQLQQEQAELQAQIKALQAQRAEALKQITPENLKIYNMLRPRKANAPVSPLDDRTCHLCGVEQTMAVVQQVRHGQELVYCSNCERILVIPG